MAATAVVAGTAGAVQHRQQQKWANQAAAQQAESADVQQAEWEQMQAQQAAAAAAAPAAAAAAPPGVSDDLMTQLNQLVQLHQAGALTDTEFAAAKAKLLA
jgi:fructose-1-phosphate kinase PfkB-like protein